MYTYARYYPCFITLDFFILIRETYNCLTTVTYMNISTYLVISNAESYLIRFLGCVMVAICCTHACNTINVNWWPDKRPWINIMITYGLKETSCINKRQVDSPITGVLCITLRKWVSCYYYWILYCWDRWGGRKPVGSLVSGGFVSRSRAHFTNMVQRKSQHG